MRNWAWDHVVLAVLPPDPYYAGVGRPARGDAKQAQAQELVLDEALDLLPRPSRSDPTE